MALGSGLDLSKAGQWLVGQQVTSGATTGAFPWTSNDFANVFTNTQGATALALLRIYAVTGAQPLLDAARRNGDCQISNCIPGWTYSDGSHQFASHDQFFLIELSRISSNPAYADFVTSNFWNRLQAGTYAPPNNYDANSFATHLFDSRTSQGIPELVAWDMSKLAIAANEAGQGIAQAAFMARIQQSLNAADSTHTTYDVIGLAGAVWASAVTGVDVNGGSGTWSGAANTAALATRLATYQAPGGGFVGSTTLAGGVIDANADAQTTAYAMRSLGLVNRAAYQTQIAAAAAFLTSLQQADGEIIDSQSSSPTDLGSVESHAESAESYVDTIAGVDRWVAPLGVDMGDCSIQANPCQTISYAISVASNNNTIHIAAGEYINPLTITKDGLRLVATDPGNKPRLKRISGSANQPLLVINGARNVHAENLEFDMDQSFVAEAVLASGFVDGLTIAGNHFVQSRSNAAVNSTYGWRNAISINDTSNSQSLGRSDGSNVTVSGNTIDGAFDAGAGVFLRCGVDMDGGVGSITGNSITTGVHDIRVRFSGTTAASTGTTTLIDGNTLDGRGLELDVPNASAGGITISNNHINAIAGISASTPYPADWSLTRLIGNEQHVAVTVSGNTFAGHAGSYRGLLIENFPGVNLAGNTFSPASGAADFVSLVVSNKELSSGTAPAPLPMAIAAQGNTFNGSGVSGAGRAVEFLNDNAAGASFGSLIFGGSGSGQANSFDGNLRWYFHLDDYNCETVNVPTCSFLDYAGDIGSNPATNTDVRPFTGNVSAANNLFAGVAPDTMTQPQQSALFAHTYDKTANPLLGVVDYGFTGTEPVAYVDDGFSGNYGDTLSFSSAAPACGTQPVFFGVNAFATIPDGLMHVQAGGIVCVARGTYAATVAINKNIQLIGDGNADTDPNNSSVITAGVTLAASGTSSSPLLLQNLRVTGVNGVGITLNGSQSYITLDRVASSSNTGDGFHAFGPGTTQNLVVTNSHFDNNGHFPPQFNGDLVAGFNFGESASASNVSIGGSTFDGNNGAGLVVNNIGSASSVSTIQHWTITGGEFNRNIPLDPPDGTFFTAGGGIWLKTGAPGSVIDDFTVNGATFADNGTGQTNHFASGDRKLNANGINVRARPNTTLTNVHLCNNTFSETPTPGTQLIGVYIFNDTASGGTYQPVDICGTTTVNNLAEGISGYEQFASRGTEPFVNISGTINISGGGQRWNYIQLTTTQNVVYVDDDFATNHNGDAVTFTHPLLGTVPATFGDNAFATIHDALARVAAGGTIYVAAGTYAETSSAGQNLLIGKSVTIFGQQAGVDARSRSGSESIIVPANAESGLNLSSFSTSAVKINANNVVLDGFVVDTDNPAITTGVGLNGSDPDVAGGIFANGSGLTLTNLIVRNAIYAGIDGGYDSAPPADGNSISNNRLINCDGASYGIGIVLEQNFYAKVTNNRMDAVRTGIQLDNNNAAAPTAGYAPTLSGNQIAAKRTGIWANLFYQTASTYQISANVITAATGGTGQWNGLWVESMQDAQTIVIQANTIDGSIASGRTRVGYLLNNIVSSAASTTAIDGGGVSNVEIGVLSTDATRYTGPVNDFIVRNVDFLNASLGALYVEDTTQTPGSAKLTVGTGNTFSNTPHQLALSGTAPTFAGGVNEVFVRSARPFVFGALASTIGNPVCSTEICLVANASINAGIAGVATAGTVNVEDGSFGENVVVNKTVILQGAKATIAGNDGSRNGSGETIVNPASGKPIFITAANASVDGFTFDGAVRSQTVVTNTAAGSNLQFINNRITNVFGAAGILIAQNTSQWTIARNLFMNFTNDTTPPTQFGQAIKYLKGNGGLIQDNVFLHVQSNALQVEQNSGIIQVLRNQIDGQTAFYTNTGLQLDGNAAASVLARDNTFTNTQNGLLIDNGSSSSTVVCNSVTNSQYGLLVLSFPTLGSENAGRVFDNALSGTIADVYSSWSPNALIVGSNYYDGTPASPGGSASLIADALAANPIGNPACGDNTPVGIVAYAGTSPQTTPVTTAFNPLRARVQDVLGGAVMNQPITLMANTAGNGATAALGTTSGTGNYNGELISTAISNGIAGSYTVDSASGSFHAAFNLTNSRGTGTVVFDNLNLTYTGSAQTLHAHMPQDASAICVLTPATVTNAGSYPVSATCDSANYTASGSATAIVAKATGTVAFDNLVYTGAVQNATAHIVEEPATTCTLTPSTVGPDAGSYAVSATCSGINYDASSNGVVIIAKAASTVTINPADLHQSFGSTHAVGASASPISLSGHVDVTYDGSATVPTATGSYSVVATLNDPNYSGTASAILVVADAAQVTLTASGPPQALISTPPFTDFLEYDGTLQNTGAATSQAVHYLITVVRIDDHNVDTGQIAIAPNDVQVCVNDPSGQQANNKGCPNSAPESLFYSEATGSLNGRSAVTFRYPINPANDVALPTIPSAVPLPPTLFRFKAGEYAVQVQIIGADNTTVYATATTGTSVPRAAVNYSGATSGQAEQILLSTLRVTNSGGPVVIGDVVVHVTLSDTGGATLAPSDADFAHQVAGQYVPLSWTQAGNNLTASLNVNTAFLPDGYRETFADAAIFHREGNYSLLFELVDKTNGTPLYASRLVTPITIGPNQVNFSLSDLNQVYDGGQHAVTVAPRNVPYTAVYELLTDASCPASPSGSNTTPPTNAGTYCVYVNATGVYSGSATGTLVVAKASAAVTIDGAVSGIVNRTFNSAPQVVTASSTPTVATIDVSYDGDTTAPTAAGSYSLLATIDDPNYDGFTTGTLIISTAGGATIVLNDDDGTVDGTIHRAYSGSAVAPVTATTVPAGVSYSVSYVGDGTTVYPLTATPPTAAGQYHVVATTTDVNYQSVSASGTLVIDTQTSTITLDTATLNAVYNGQIHAVTATTNPAGLSYSVTYDGSPNAPVDAGMYNVVATITDANHAGSVNGVLTITPATGSVVFGTTSFIFDGTAHTTTAVISQEPGNASACTISYVPAAPLHVGSATATATCTGTNYNASAGTTLTVTPAPATIALNGTGSFVFDNADHVATASVSGAVAGFPATAAISYNGSATAPHNVGVYNVVATLDAASSDYTATPASGVIQITPAAATVNLSNLVQVFDGTAKSATVTTSPASLAVSVTYDGSATPPSAVGNYSVLATVTDPNYAGSANGVLQILGSGTAATITANSSTSFSGTAGTVASPLPSVKVTDTNGNPVPGYHVTFVAGSNSGTLSGVSQTTDAGGIATVGGWILGTAASETVSVTDALLSGSPVIFTASVTSEFDLAVNITDNRDFVQYGRTVDYVIVVSNSGPSLASNTVTDNLPPELDVASADWVCFSHTTGATCTASGSGNLSDTPSIPSGGSVTYVLSASVGTDPAMINDVVINQVSIDTNGDSDTSNNSATSTTQIVIFRDGFEQGGDGAQRINGSFGLTTSLDDAATLTLDPAFAPVANVAPVTWLRVQDAQGHSVFRVDVMGSGADAILRMVSNTANGKETATRWMPLQSAALGLAGSSGSYLALLAGTHDALQVPMPASVTLPLKIYTAQ